MLKYGVLLITGGTGFFGNEVLKSFSQTDTKETRIFSRDDKKQYDMRKKYNNPVLKFCIGEVRNSKSFDISPTINHNEADK